MSKLLPSESNPGFLRRNIGKLIIALIIVVLFFKFKSCNDITIPVTSDVDTLYWKNRYDDAVTSLRAKDEYFEAAERKWKDSIAKVYKTKPKFIKEIVTIVEKAEVDIPPVGNVEKDYVPVINCPPAIKNMRQWFSNPYYEADVQIGDSSYMHLLARDTLTVLWKKIKNELQLDISHANPSVKIEGIKAYRIADKKPKQWAIGFQLGCGITYKAGEVNVVPYYGFGITKTIIRF